LVGLTAGYVSIVLSLTAALLFGGTWFFRRAVRAVTAPADHYFAATCVGNLEQIDLAKELWAAQALARHGAAVDAAALSVVAPAIAELQCPSKGTYAINPIGTNPACSSEGHVLLPDAAGAERDPDGAFSAELFQRIQPRPPARSATDFFLVTRPPEAVPAYTLAEIEAIWPIFGHARYHTAGFNPLVLPFLSPAEDASGGTNSGHAFSFLLSWALDWVPGNFSTRHSYFVFKRTGAPILRAARTRDKDAIQALNKRWHTTHAIGGRLLRAPGGYGAEVQIYGREGRPLRERRYEPTQSFLDLLATVTCDAMVDLGYKPDPRLKDLLRAPVFTHPETIQDLGAAAFAEERSGDEFSRYRRILDRDPGFAEVRYWIANQGFWQHDNETSLDKQRWRALQDHIMPAALIAVHRYELPGAEDRRRLDWMRQQAAFFLGADSPFCVVNRFEDERNEPGGVSGPMLAQGLFTAWHCPNEGFLLQTLSYVSGDDARGPHDAALAGGLALAALRGQQMTEGSGTRYRAWYFARGAAALGYHHLAARIFVPLAQWTLAQPGVENEGKYLLDALAAMCAVGWYSDAADVARQAFLRCQDRDSYWLTSYSAYTVMCASLAGRQDLLAELEKKPYATGEILPNRIVNNAALLTTLAVPHAPEIGSICKRLAVGDVVGATNKLLVTSPVFSPFDLNRNAWALPIYAYLELRQHKTAYRSQVAQMLAVEPQVRNLWRAYDLYDQFQPSAECVPFYTYLEWLHSDDPWVRDAVAVRKQRLAPTPFDPMPIIEAFRPYTPMPWPHVGPPGNGASTNTIFLYQPPYAVTAAVKALLDRKEYDAAQDLVFRAYAAAHQDDLQSLMCQFNYLYHIITAARQGRRAIIGNPLPAPWPRKGLRGLRRAPGLARERRSVCAERSRCE
jgi:hypothetical protein